MIYTLTNTVRNQVQWQDIIYEQDYLDITIIHHNTDMEKFAYIGDYLQLDSNFDKLRKLEKTDILLIDDSYLLTDYSTDFAKSIIRKFNELVCDIIIISKNNLITEELNTDRCTIFSPAIYNSYPGLLLNSFNPGLVTSSHHELYYVVNKLLNSLKDIPRYKKFNFIHDDLTPNSCYISFLMNKFGVIQETLYTNPKLHSSDRITPNNHMYNYQNILVNSFGQDVSNRISSNEYYEYINSLNNNGSLKMDWSDRFETISPYNLNSYVSIVAPDLCNSDDYQLASNNLFRPFFWKNIPLFIGSNHTQDVVKNYGFDLFEDVFELPTENIRGLDRVNIFFENIQRINTKTYSELHELHNSINHRLDNNFNLLRELGTKNIKHLINLIIKK